MSLKMPVTFSGHGFPMIALKDNEIIHDKEEVG